MYHRFVGLWDKSLVYREVRSTTVRKKRGFSIAFWAEMCTTIESDLQVSMERVRIVFSQRWLQQMYFQFAISSVADAATIIVVNLYIRSFAKIDDVKMVNSIFVPTTHTHALWIGNIFKCILLVHSLHLQEYSVQITFRQTWNDDRLSYENRLTHGDMRGMYLQNTIWNQMQQQQQQKRIPIPSAIHNVFLVSVDPLSFDHRHHHHHREWSTSEREVVNQDMMVFLGAVCVRAHYGKLIQVDLLLLIRYLVPLFSLQFIFLNQWFFGGVPLVAKCTNTFLERRYFWSTPTLLGWINDPFLLDSTNRGGGLLPSHHPGRWRCCDVCSWGAEE